jgi:oligosaccharide repeat unit polymerase
VVASPVHIGIWTYAVIVAFSLVTLAWSYYSVKELATLVGYREGEDLLIQYGRLAVLQYELRASTVLIIFGFMLRALSHVFTFAYLHNRILSRQKTKLGALLLVPSLIYLIQYMLWGSRGGVIEYISFFIFVYAYFKSRVVRNQKEFNLEISRIAIKGFALFILIFIGAGALKGWAESNPFEIVAIYGGGSLSGLDIYLKSTALHSTVFGEETLLGIYALLERVGVSSVSSSRILEFTAIGQMVEGNIYTSLRRYINDYGVLGMIFLQFALGYLFSLGLMQLKRSKKIGYFSLLYSMLFVTLVYQALDEQVLTSFLSTTQLFTVLFTFLFYRLLLRKKLNKPEQTVRQTA